jgi:hypothetical protein
MSTLTPLAVVACISQKGKDGKQFYIGSSSVALAEELSNVCKFDAVIARPKP